MRKLLLPILCLSLLLCACASGKNEVSPEIKPWPSHAPDATPYVRFDSKEAPQSEAVEEKHGSYEEFMRSIFVQEGSLFFKEDELKAFRELPQNEPYSFAAHLEPMWTQDKRLPENDGEIQRLSLELEQEIMQSGIESKRSKELSRRLSERIEELNLYSEEYYRIQEQVQLEYCTETAQAFADKGCEARVLCSTGIESGVECRDYLTVISTTPEKLFEISTQMEKLYLLEPFYPGVEQRFTEEVWSAEE